MHHTYKSAYLDVQNNMADRRSGFITRAKFSHSIDPDEPYPMDLPRLGHAVIINNVATEMPQSEEDVKSLRDAYKTMGFEVQVHTDCTTQEMRKLKRWILDDKSHKDSNSFLITVICHGNKHGHLLDENKNKAWDTEEFLGDLSEVETLVGKPKIMIVQSCRGNKTQRGGRETPRDLAEDEDMTPPVIVVDKADLFIGYATVPGYKAYAGDDDGSIYLQCFATFLQEYYMKRPLDRIFLMVKQAMIKTKQGEQETVQCSEERSSLTRILHFGQYHGVTLSEQKGMDRSDSGEDLEVLKREIEKQRAEVERQQREMMQEMDRIRATESETSRRLRVTESETKLREEKMKRETEQRMLREMEERVQREIERQKKEAAEKLAQMEREMEKMKTAKAEALRKLEKEQRQLNEEEIKPETERRMKIEMEERMQREMERQKKEAAEKLSQMEQEMKKMKTPESETVRKPEKEQKKTAKVTRSSSRRGIFGILFPKKKETASTKPDHQKEITEASQQKKETGPTEPDLQKEITNASRPNKETGPAQPKPQKEITEASKERKETRPTQPDLRREITEASQLRCTVTRTINTGFSADWDSCMCLLQDDTVLVSGIEDGSRSIKRYNQQGAEVSRGKLKRRPCGIMAVELSSRMAVALSDKEKKQIEFRDVTDLSHVVLTHSVKPHEPGILHASGPALLYEDQSKRPCIVRSLDCSTGKPRPAEGKSTINSKQRTLRDMCCACDEDKQLLITTCSGGVFCYNMWDDQLLWEVSEQLKGMKRKMSVEGVTTDGRGLIYVCDRNPIQVFSVSGRYLGSLKLEGLGEPYCVRWCSNTSSLIMLHKNGKYQISFITVE